MAGPVTVTCPSCRVAFPVPCEVLGTDGPEVIVRMDRSDLYGHLETCTGSQAEPAEQPAQAAEISSPGKALERPPLAQPHDLPPFCAKGRRTCTMCGTANAVCMESLANSVPCCGACGEGDTHPAPGDR